MKSRIGEIVWFLRRAKARGARLVGNSALEKELQSILEAEPVMLPNNNPGIYNTDGTPQIPPKTYEQWERED